MGGVNERIAINQTSLEEKALGSWHRFCTQKIGGNLTGHHLESDTHQRRLRAYLDELTWDEGKSS